MGPHAPVIIDVLLEAGSAAASGSIYVSMVVGVDIVVKGPHAPNVIEVDLEGCQELY